MRCSIFIFVVIVMGCGGPSAPTSVEVAAGQSPSEGDIAYYTCPMHPSIQQPGPGSCPICGMTLTPVVRAELETGAVRVDAVRRARFGIELEAAAVRPMGSSLHIPAILTWDADRLQDVSIRVSGWVKNVRGAPGEPVRAGQVLFTLFSPELVAAQDDLLRATLQAAGGDPASVGRRDAARLRLLRWGVPADLLDQIIQEGHTMEDVPFRAPKSGWVLDRTAVEGGMANPGQTLYRLGDLSRLWLEGAVPEDRLSAVAVGQVVSVRVSGIQESIPARVDRVLPTLDALTRTARIRVALDNTSARLRPDQWASIEVEVGDGNHLSVPESAVLYTGPRRIVFVDTGNDLLMPREVRVGMKSDGYVQILEGLKEGEQIVRAGNFLVAADSRLKRGGETRGESEMHELNQPGTP